VAALATFSRLEMLKPIDRTRAILGNTVVLTLGQVSGIAVSILLTPYIVHTLGIERYGLWAFLSSVVAFAGLLQFGIGKGSVRFIAFYSERNELDIVRRIVSYVVLSHVVAGVILIPIAWLTARAIVPHLHISRTLAPTAETLFPLIFAYSFFAGAVRPLGMLLIGLERMWMTSAVALLSQLVYAAGVVALLSHGLGLYGLVVATFMQIAFQGLACYLIGRHLIGRVLGNPFRLGRAVLKEMLKFGSWIQVNSVAGLVNSQTDAIVIGSWVNVESVGLYAIGNRIAQLVRMIPLTLLPPLLPAVAGIHAQGDDERIARTVLQGSRFVGLLTIGMSGFVLATAPLIMTVWLGQSYPHVVAITVLLVVAYAVNNLTGVGTTVISAVGRPRYESEYAVLGMVLNIAATVALAPFFGLYGILGGTVIGVGLCSVYFLWRFHRIMRLPLWEYLGTWLWRVVGSAVLAGFALFVLRSALPSAIDGNRGVGLLALVGLGLVYTAVLLVCLRAFKFFQTRDLATLRRVLPSRLQGLARLAPVEFLFRGTPHL
jgi:O-antigen/teichoic acid export membrane protein